MKRKFLKRKSITQSYHLLESIEKNVENTTLINPIATKTTPPIHAQTNLAFVIFFNCFYRLSYISGDSSSYS